MSKARALHYTRTNIWWYVLYPWGTTMIQTKAEEAKENKIRAELEELTKEIVWLESKIEDKQKEINRLPAHKLKFLRDLVNERGVLEGRKEYLEWKRNEKINLLNQIS